MGRIRRPKVIYDEEALLIEVIKNIRRKYPVIGIDSQIYYTADNLYSQLVYRLEHKETKEVLAITFHVKSVEKLYTTVVIEGALEKICKQLMLRQNTLVEVQELLNTYPVNIVLEIHKEELDGCTKQ